MWAVEVIIVKGLMKPDKLLVFLCQENAVHLLDLKVKSLGCNRKTQVFSEAVADKLSALKPLRCTALQVFLMKLFLSTWRAGTLQRIYSRIGHA